MCNEHQYVHITTAGTDQLEHSGIVFWMKLIRPQDVMRLSLNTKGLGQHVRTFLRPSGG